MSKLLRANCVRLFKNKPLYLCVCIQAVMTFFDILPYRNDFFIENIFYGNSIVSMLFSAVFVPLFLGTEHSDKTIRNKIITGHTRREIYLASFISAAAGVLIICLTPLVTAFIMALPFGGHLGSSLAEFALYFTVLTAANTAMCGIYLISAMLVTSKANNVVLTLAIWFGSIFITATIDELLELPQISDSVLRAILRYAYDINPVGQVLQIRIGECRNAGLFPVYSLLVIAAATGLGVLIFRRKDLK